MGISLLNKRGMLSAAVLAVTLAAGCARVQEASPVRIPFVEAKPEVTVSPRLSKEPPGTVALLPFGSLGKADPKKVDGRNLLRSNLYSYLRVYPFECMDIKEVDQVLEKNGMTDIGRINAATPAELGSLLGVDAVIYGDIKSAINFTGGVYSITQLNGTLKMVDVKNGEVLWQCKYFEKSIGGVISTDSAELVSIIESQMENAKVSLAYTRCADAFSRKVLGTLPDIKAVVPVPARLDKVEVLPAGKKLFTLFDTVEVVMTGEGGLPAVFDIGTVKENIPMVEIRPGVYRGTYTVSRGDTAREACVVGKLGVAALGRQSVVAGPAPISIEACPPDQPKNLTFKMGENKEIVLAWDPPQSGSVAVYEVYRAPDYTFRYVCVGTTDRVSYTDTPGALAPIPGRVFYQVIARDAHNNKSDPSEPLKVPLD